MSFIKVARILSLSLSLSLSLFSLLSSLSHPSLHQQHLHRLKLFVIPFLATGSLPAASTQGLLPCIPQASSFSSSSFFSSSSSCHASCVLVPPNAFLFPSAVYLGLLLLLILFLLLLSFLYPPLPSPSTGTYRSLSLAHCIFSSRLVSCFLFPFLFNVSQHFPLSFSLHSFLFILFPIYLWPTLSFQTN